MRDLFDAGWAADQANKKESWRAVLGYEGLYEVSSLGSVRRVAGEVQVATRWGGVASKSVPSRVLAQTPDNGKHCYGRLTVKLSANGVARTRLVHQLVAEAFIGPRPDGMEVAHGDGNTQNNTAANLRYATPAENTADKLRHGTVLQGSAVATSKLTGEQARQIIKRRASGERVQSVADAFGISIAQVSRIASGKRWGHINA